MTPALIRSFKLRIEFLKFSHYLSGKYILCLMKIQGPMNHIQMPIDKMRAKLMKSYIVSQGMHLRPKRWKAFDDSSGTHSEDSG